MVFSSMTKQRQYLPFSFFQNEFCKEQEEYSKGNEINHVACINHSAAHGGIMCTDARLRKDVRQPGAGNRREGAERIKSGIKEKASDHGKNECDHLVIADGGR